MKVNTTMYHHCMVGVNCLKYGYALALGGGVASNLVGRAGGGGDCPAPPRYTAEGCLPV